MKKYEIVLSNQVTLRTTAADEEEATELAYEAMFRDEEDGIRIVTVREVSP